MRSLFRRHKRPRRGFSLLELIVTMIVLAVIIAIAIPTFTGVINRAADHAHLTTLTEVGSVTAATYANGSGTPTWVDALTQVASETNLASDTNNIIPSAAATLIAPSFGASLATNTISYALQPDGVAPVVRGAQLGLASMNASTTCSMVLVGVSGVLASWVAGKLGANCTGANALGGPSASRTITYLSPADAGAPNPLTVSDVVTQTYDSVTNTYSGPNFTITPSTSTFVASDNITRNGTAIGSIPADSTTFTDTTSTPGRSYTYAFTAVSTHGVSSTPATLVVTTRPGTLSGGAITYVIASTLANATITWNLPATSDLISGYHIYKDGTLVDTIASKSITTEAVPAQSLGIPYIFKVVPYNSAGDGIGATLPITFTDIAAAPSLNAPTPGDASAVVTWNPPVSTTTAPISGFRLYSSENSGAYTLVTQITDPSASTYTDNSLSNGNSFTYEMQTYGPGGTSIMSSPSAAVVPLGPPVTPVILSATSPSSGTITVNFTTTSSAPAPVTTITVTRNGSAYLTLPSSATTFTDSTAVNGTAYTYAITAANPVSHSLAATTSPLTPIGAPAAPVFTTTTAGNTTNSLVWSTVAGTTGYPVTGYRLYSSVDSSAYTLLTAQSGTSFTVTALTNGHNYTYEVQTYGPGGTSAMSAPSPTLTPVAPPIAPPTISAVASDSALAISWTAVASTVDRPVNGYLLLASTTSAAGPWAGIYVGPALNYNYTALSNGSTYYLKVAATNTITGTGVGTYSSVISATPLAIPPTPTPFTATQANSAIALSWTPSASTTATPVSGYRIYRATSFSGPFTLLSNPTPDSANSYTDSSVSLGTTYWYEIEAYGAGGTSARSAPTPTLGITAITTPPVIPSINTSPASASITVTWTAPTAKASQPVTGYKLEYVVGSLGGTWFTIYTGPLTTYTQTGLANGTNYYYRVSATNPVGAGPTITSTVASAYSIPVAPTAPAAAQGNNQINITWTAVAPSPGTPITGYDLYRAVGSPSGFTLLQTLVGAATSSYSDTAVTPGTTYYYTLDSYNVVGPSAQTTIFPSGGIVDIAPPSAAPTLTAVAGYTQNTISWTAVTATAAQPVSSYTLQNSPTSASGPWSTIYTGSSLNYTDTSLTNGQQYFYQVQATNIAGPGPFSAQTSSSNATPITTPGAPTNPLATAGNAQATVTWTPVASTSSAPVSGYYIYRSTSTSGPFTLDQSVPGAAVATATSTGLTNGLTYYYKMATYGTAGTGPSTAYFNNPTGVTPIGAPAPITGLTTTGAAPSVTATWKAVTSTTAAPVTNISVLKNGTVVATLASSATSYTYSSLTSGTGSGTTYSFQLRTTNAVGNSALATVTNQLYTASSSTQYSCASGSYQGTGSAAGSCGTYTTYSCPSGGSLSGSTCITSLPSNYSATPTYICDQGGSLSGTTCVNVYTSYAATSSGGGSAICPVNTPAYTSLVNGVCSYYYSSSHLNYSCPSGTLSGLNCYNIVGQVPYTNAGFITYCSGVGTLHGTAGSYTCYILIGSATDNQYCPSGGSLSSPFVCQVSTSSYIPPIVYSCPSGGSLGTYPYNTQQCYTFYANYAANISGYTCPSGGSLNNSDLRCYISGSSYSATGTPTNYPPATGTPVSTCALGGIQYSTECVIVS